MNNRKINKQCPFCPMKPYEHTFKTYYGLIRHILRWHAMTETKRHWWEGQASHKICYVRLYTVKFSKFVDFEVEGREHLESLIDLYCGGEWNPSSRQASSEKLRGLLGLE